MSRPFHPLICLLSLGLAANSFGDDSGNSGAVIEANKKTVSAQVAAIDTEKFELGGYLGMLSVEDFNSNPVTGLSLVYHINNRFLAQVNYGTSTVGRAAFEEIVGGNFLADGDYDFEYVNVLAGYKLLDGRSFLGKRHKYNSSIYIMAGPTQVSFAGEDNTGIVFGASYRTVMTDWLTMNLDVRNTLVDRDFLEDNKKTNNTEMFLGINALF